MNKEEIDKLMLEGEFPEGDTPSELIETSISWVLLGNKFAWKIKKPCQLIQRNVWS